MWGHWACCTLYIGFKIRSASSVRLAPNFSIDVDLFHGSPRTHEMVMIKEDIPYVEDSCADLLPPINKIEETRLIIRNQCYEDAA